jgi:hypothetical protein
VASALTAVATGLLFWENGKSSLYHKFPTVLVLCLMVSINYFFQGLSTTGKTLVPKVNNLFTLIE